MKYKINLLPQKETTIAEKVMFFLLNYLRYIIVITQLVVIGVFFYRFQIDQKIIDLKESVMQKKEIVEIVLPLLNEASRIDQKSQEINKVIKKQQNFNEMLKYLLSISTYFFHCKPRYSKTSSTNSFTLCVWTVAIT